MVLRKVTGVNEEKPLFRLFFLKEEDPGVEIVEVEEIDFKEVERRLKQEESVFITRKRKQKLNTTLVAKESVAEPWYLTRI